MDDYQFSDETLDSLIASKLDLTDRSYEKVLDGVDIDSVAK